MLSPKRRSSLGDAPSARSPARLCRAGLTSLALAACAAPAASPPGLRDAPRSALHAAPATPAARPPLAAPEARPPVAPGEAGAPRPDLSLVLTSTVTQVEVAPFPGGAVLFDRSLLAIVRGRETRQDPAWLAGLPEYINWWSLRGYSPYGTHVDLRLPPYQPAPAADVLPRGAILDVQAALSAAGYSWEMPRHFFTWNGDRWLRARANAAGGPPTDPRLGNVAQRWEHYEAAAVTAGQLLVISDHSFNDRAAFLLGPGRGPATPLWLPFDDESSWSLVQLEGTEAGEAYLCTYDALVRWGEGRWEEQDLPEGRIVSCAGTADGTQWLVVTREVAEVEASRRRPVLLRRPRGEAWSAVPLPGGAWPVRIAASGERLWIHASVGETRSPSRFEVYSNAPIDVPMTLSEVQIPWWHDPDGREHDPPAVGDWPPGPATSACTSPVVYLGRSLTPALQSALRRHTETEGVPLVEVEGTAHGKTSEVRSSPGKPRGLRYHPTRARVRGVAILPATVSDGIRIAELLAPDLPDLPPRVVCAKPRIRRRLSAGGT